MAKNIKDFLLKYDFEELKHLRILNKQGGRSDKFVLNRHSVRPLIELMNKEGIEKLEYPGFYGDDEWYLDSKGRFKNPLSKDIKEGNIDQLDQVGTVFDETNRVFNPYFEKAETTTKLPDKNINTLTIKKEFNDMVLLQKKKQIILYGPPGTGKTYNTKELAVKILGGELKDSSNEYEKYRQEGRVEFITFHPSYSYEEFIEGITVVTEGEDVVTDSIKYKLKPGIFKKICTRALGKALDSSDEKLASKKWIDVFNKYLTLRKKVDFDKSPKHVLIIDEINRGDIAKIFGELITLLEADKRLGEDNELIVKLPASNDEFCVPPNLYIIATMNTADRSIALLDVALRRRFGFIEMNPDFLALLEHADKNKNRFDSRSHELLKESIEAVKKINEEISKNKAIGRDRQIGHSFFFKVASLDDLVLVWRHEILPLLEEYCYGDYLKINQILFDSDSDTSWISQTDGIREINSSNIADMLNYILRHD